METVTAYKLNQSLIKDYQDYKMGKSCGLQIKAKYFDGVEFPATELQKLGQWFEYIGTGGLPRNGQVPEPEKTQKGELTAKYKIMKVQAERLKEALKYHGFQIDHVGAKIQHEDLIGTADLLCTYKGGPAIVDVKSSGLLHDKWNEMGWEEESLPEKWKLMIQAVHYKYIYKLKFGVEARFFFFVHSNTNDIESAIFEVIIEEGAFERHEKQIRLIRSAIDLELTIGWKAVPTVKRCADCPLFESCSEKITVPKIKKIYIS